MANDLKFAKCQQCGKTAKGESEIKVLFGCRTFQENIYVQSWCVDCRAHS